MPTKRYALVLRLWQVKTETLYTDAPAWQDDRSADGEQQPYHWRGAVQVAGEEPIYYFDSWQTMHQLIEQLVNKSC